MSNDTKTPTSKKITEKDLPAGDFSSWLRQIRNAFLGESGIDVDCGECVGCCTSSYFIHIKPNEKEALGRIGKEVLFPAPGMPKGHVLMGYDKKGLCPMFRKGACSIYEHRPQTCRDYDCRVFTAAGIEAGGDDKAVINERVKRWKFSYPGSSDRDEHLAVQAAAKFIQEHADCFPGGRAPDNPSQLAILAIKVYDVFLTKNGEKAAAGDASLNTAIANAIVEACRKFDARMPVKLGHFSG